MAIRRTVSGRGRETGPRRGRSLRRRERGRRLRRWRRGREPGRSARRGAEQRLRNFRQASIVAVALTGLLLMIFAPQEAGTAQAPDTLAADTTAADSLADLPDSVAVIRWIPIEQLQGEPVEEVTPDSAAREAAAEATGALRELWEGFVGNLPKYLIALGILVAAWIVVRLLRTVLRRTLGQWERANAVTALSGVVIWLLALGIAISVLVGDIRALVGSLGLVGLALSWALQTPIESFTGWLMNSFHGFYRVGDRIAVGEVFGDVYRINFLTTTVWEYGGPDRPPGSVQAEQPTGRLITFPNSEILAGTVVNYTRDFPYVWDELSLAVANESDLTYAMEVLQRLAERELRSYMEEPARRYAALLQREGLEYSIADHPQVFASLTDWSANLTIRYLVEVREKRVWKSRLSLRATEEINREEHAGRILPVYPRQQIQMIDPDGRPREPFQVPGTR
jgi:small-conductance mechanosensitive channel